MLMRYSPSAGKLCLNRMPPRVPGGSGSSLILVGGDGVLHIRNMAGGIADREFRNVPRSGDVLIEERGRDAQSGRDVVEAVHLDILRQDVLRIHIHAHQSFHRRGVLGAVQALDRHIAAPFGPLGWESSVFSIQAANESTSFCGGWGLPGGGIKCPRSLRSAFSQICASSGAALEIQTVQREAADLRARVVAGDAVGGQHRVILILPLAGGWKVASEAIRTSQINNLQPNLAIQSSFITNVTRTGRRLRFPRGVVLLVLLGTVACKKVVSPD